MTKNAMKRRKVAGRTLIKTSPFICYRIFLIIYLHHVIHVNNTNYLSTKRGKDKPIKTDINNIIFL